MRLATTSLLLLALAGGEAHARLEPLATDTGSWMFDRLLSLRR